MKATSRVALLMAILGSSWVLVAQGPERLDRHDLLAFWASWLPGRCT